MTGTGPNRVLLTLPPRHGKSTLCDLWTPVWFLRNWPHRRIILATYETSYSARWGRRVRNECIEHGRLLGVQVAGDSRSATEWDTSEGGGMTSVGVGGGLTGKGADLLLIDDPVKNAEQARSEVYREKTEEFFRETASTRLEPGAAIIVIMTRWHEDDLMGRLIRSTEEGSGNWTLIRYPALAEHPDDAGGVADPLGRRPGEALWPERFDAAALEAKRREVGEYGWASQYQGSPRPPSGNIFRREWWEWRRWRIMRRQQQDEARVHFRDGYSCPLSSMVRFLVCDTAASERTEADRTWVMAFGGCPDGRLVVLDAAYGRMQAPEIPHAISSLLVAYDAKAVWRENFGEGHLSQIQAWRREPFRFPVRTIGRSASDSLRVEGDKVSRAFAVAPWVEAGMLWVPDRPAPLWWSEAEGELLGFPRAAHDDAVDVVVYACLAWDRMRRQGGLLVPEAPPGSRLGFLAGLRPRSQGPPV